MAEPRHQRAGLTPRLHRDLGDVPKRRVVGPLLAVLLQRVGEEVRRVAGRRC
jgi:hypothetical protein